MGQFYQQASPKCDYLKHKLAEGPSKKKNTCAWVKAKTKENQSD